MIVKIVSALTSSLGVYESQVENRLQEWKKQAFARRLWDKDPTLWFPEPQSEFSDRLGWLDLPEAMLEQLEELGRFGRRVRDEGLTRVVLLGMGGSSLAPEVFQKTFRNAPGFPELTVLDSTHPGAVRAVENYLDLGRTLFLVSSKSGTTLETLSLFRYFWKRVKEIGEEPGSHFAAITDPGTPLERLARERSFRTIFLAPPDVGGRYSALSVFGMVPAALIGVDIRRLLDRARSAAESCASPAAAYKSAGLILGAVIGELASARDKLTIHATPSLSSFPDWLEQLIAESTGKDGKGIVPVVGEPRTEAESYGQDRVFVGFFLQGQDDPELSRFLESLESRGHPVIRIFLADPYNLGQEIFRWEVAVASAGSVLGIHPFNQPDVQLAKNLARKAMASGESQKSPDIEVQTLTADKPGAVKTEFHRWLTQCQAGDYISIQAYLVSDGETTAALQGLRRRLLERTGLATTLGFGPRFLHSTGQLHKGGPNTGLVLQIVDEPEEDLPVPEAGFSFGQLIRAQAWGDYQALEQRGRRILRVSLGLESAAGLKRLEEFLTE